eukprot:gnl/MRDRNA2_/MRDRNA2_92864_c0_seq1.p1 gnl/MRDRNA2_/MRDRNA2_92864_c0~~gnl/MRDRNA2_/MRDRNA2_92864_c0_seq1.p1  ORF type:complete len:264 (+),score=64.87 gnl/MRDRNA2_/MRDRNA2_92864_c0_seq1:60-851(+)
MADGRALLRNFQARRSRGLLPGGEPALLPEARRAKLLAHGTYGYKAVDTVLRGDAAREALEAARMRKELTARLEALTATAKELEEDLAKEKQLTDEVATSVPEQQNLMMNAKDTNDALSAKLQESEKRREDLVKEEKRLRESLKDRGVGGDAEPKTQWGQCCREFEGRLQPFLGRGGDLELMELTGALFQDYAALSQRAAEVGDSLADQENLEQTDEYQTNGHHAERLRLYRNWAVQLAAENDDLRKRVAKLSLTGTSATGPS